MSAGELRRAENAAAWVAGELRRAASAAAWVAACAASAPLALPAAAQAQERAGTSARLQQGASGTQQSRPREGIQVLHVRGPIYLLAGDGANVTASIGPDGVLLVDTGEGALTEDLIAAVRERERERRRQATLVAPVGGTETRSAAQFLRAPLPPPAPIRYIINTGADPRHTGGNEKIGQVPREMSFQSPLELATRRFAYENVLLRMSASLGEDPARPYEAWPSDTYVSEYYKLSSHFNGEGIELIHVPAAHTDGDSIVWFRGSDVISTGDIFQTTAYPTPDTRRGGSIQGVLEGLNRLVDLAQPEYRDEGGTLLIPGHGRLSDFGDLVYYRDAITIVRDRVQHMIAEGMTLEQVKAARPSFEYDARYGRAPGTTEQFIEAVYEGLVHSE